LLHFGGGKKFPVKSMDDCSGPGFRGPKLIAGGMIGVAVGIDYPPDGELMAGDVLSHSFRGGGRIDEHPVTGGRTTEDITDNFQRPYFYGFYDEIHLNPSFRIIFWLQFSSSD
jgi:hypothetical protein